MRRNITRLEALARIIWLAVACGVFLCGRPSGQADERREPLSEYQVKAAFLYNFAKFVEWPTASSAGVPELVIGIWGDDPFGAVLDNVVRGKTVSQRPLLIRRLTRMEEARSCQVLFVSRSEQERLSPLLEILRGQPVLTVSESDRFAQRGGMINFILVNENVKLEINPNAATAAKLKIKSNLLSLAKIVNPDPAR